MNSYVTFLDILGFADLICSTPLKDLLKKMKNAFAFSKFAEVLGAWQNKNGTIYPDLTKKRCQCFSFSDTFVISTPDKSLDSLNVIIGATFILSRVLFGMGMPVRGAISTGETDFVPDTQHLIGKGVIRAANLEKRQKWFGIAIDPEVVDKNSVSRLEKVTQEIVVPYEVPFAGNERRECIVINWRLNLYVEKGTKSLFPSPKDEEHELKRENALEFAKYIRESRQAYKQFNEPWLQNFIVAAGGPPQDTTSVQLNHGDEY